MKSLEEKNKSIRFILGKKVGKQMRIVPELRFFVDDSLDYIDKNRRIIKIIHLSGHRSSLSDINSIQE